MGHGKIAERSSRSEVCRAKFAERSSRSEARSEALSIVHTLSKQCPSSLQTCPYVGLLVQACKSCLHRRQKHTKDTVQNVSKQCPSSVQACPSACFFVQAYKKRLSKSYKLQHSVVQAFGATDLFIILKKEGRPWGPVRCLLLEFYRH